MPLLQAETNLFPDDLLSRDDIVDVGPWWAAYTISRQEKVLMRRLLALGIGFYCPIAPKTYRSSGGRRRTSHLPLFPNYVFVQGDELTRHTTMTTGAVSHCLAVPDPSRFVRQLADIEQGLRGGVHMTFEATLLPGKHVRVRSGPMEGVEGVIFERRGKTRLLLRLEFMQQGASLVVEDWEVEPL